MLNNISVMGRLTADPELRVTPNGVSVCSFTIANDKDFKKDGDAPNWIDCVAWRNEADFISRCFKKGALIIITGSLNTRQFEDKNGNKRKVTEVVVNQSYFATTKRENATERAANEPQQEYEPATAEDFTVDSQDDLPF